MMMIKNWNQRHRVFFWVTYLLGTFNIYAAPSPWALVSKVYNDPKTKGALTVDFPSHLLSMEKYQDFSVISQEQQDVLYKDAITSDHANVAQANHCSDFCYFRAHLISTYLMKEHGLQTVKVIVKPKDKRKFLKVKGIDNYFHLAIGVYVSGDRGQHAVYIWDPYCMKTPVGLDDWLADLEFDPTSHDLCLKSTSMYSWSSQFDCWVSVSDMKNPLDMKRHTYMPPQRPNPFR